MEKTSDWRTVKFYDSGSSCPSSSDYTYIVWDNREWVPEDNVGNGVWYPKIGDVVWVSTGQLGLNNRIWVSPDDSHIDDMMCVGEWWIPLKKKEVPKETKRASNDRKVRKTVIAVDNLKYYVVFKGNTYYRPKNGINVWEGDRLQVRRSDDHKSINVMRRLDSGALFHDVWKIDQSLLVQPKVTKVSSDVDMKIDLHIKTLQEEIEKLRKIVNDTQLEIQAKEEMITFAELKRPQFVTFDIQTARDLVDFYLLLKELV